MRCHGLRRAPPRALLALVLVATTYSLVSFARPIRSVEVDEGSITVIRTAIGYSTILQFQSKPISAVVGDQDAFKLEFVANSITIKPLLPRARSNVFIFTDYERFNCQLIAGPPSEVDYIVRIRGKTEKAYPVETGAAPAGVASPEAPSPMLTRSTHRTASYGGYTLTLLSVSHDRDLARPRAVTLLDFELSSKRTRYRFGPGSLGVKQAGKFLDLESLYLDRLELIPGAPPVHGKLALLSQDFWPTEPVTLIFATPKEHNPSGIYRLEVTTARPARPTGKAKMPTTAIFPIPIPLPSPTPSPSPSSTPLKENPHGKGK